MRSELLLRVPLEKTICEFLPWGCQVSPAETRGVKATRDAEAGDGGCCA